ncbi:KOW domain-containing RNA-binding protein [Paenibacillus endoradicis]|uniref:KOW domain-containing RNA-binding protein n=1 Tax=Paenibacillus endoradicis TaxID=2972487 RepID=UPI002159015C|nr:KOW domain-containing RNA-binding protein [Paenibacillus endoradicis]MCR8660694.1 KOW domain-containing RNA-binding protein [Paenibacillus endoradicis]
MKPVQIGQLIKVLRGKDEERYAIVIEVLDERFVKVADGRKRKFDQPKKKNVLHLELLPFISQEVAISLQESGKVTNAKLRYFIEKYAHGKES